MDGFHIQRHEILEKKMLFRGRRIRYISLKPRQKSNDNQIENKFTIFKVSSRFLNFLLIWFLFLLPQLKHYKSLKVVKPATVQLSSMAMKTMRAMRRKLSSHHHRQRKRKQKAEIGRIQSSFFIKYHTSFESSKCVLFLDSGNY